MKKLFVLAVFIAVIGILCAVFFIHPNTDKKGSDEKPWTVGDVVETSETDAQTTEKKEKDAVSAFTDFIDGKLRESSLLMDEGVPYPPEELKNAVYGLYIYDMDTDGTEELAVVRTGEDGAYLDVYEYASDTVRLASSIRLVLDSANDIALKPDLTTFTHIAARMTIYPQGSDRYLCLTVEQQGQYGDYNAYTSVLEYAKEKLSVKQSFRLRRIGEALTLMRLGDNTLLYRRVTEADEGEVALAKYSDLDTAFKTEYAKYGLTAPEIKLENGALAQYKVTAVPSEQHVFEFATENGAIRVIENGFLQSFLIRH